MLGVPTTRAKYFHIFPHQHIIFCLTCTTPCTYYICGMKHPIYTAWVRHKNKGKTRDSVIKQHKDIKQHRYRQRYRQRDTDTQTQGWWREQMTDGTKLTPDEVKSLNKTAAWEREEREREREREREKERERERERERCDSKKSVCLWRA